MNTKIKAVLAILVIALMAVALAGCGPDQAAQIAELEAALAEAEAVAEGAVSEEELEAAQAALEEAQAALEEAQAAEAGDTEETFLTWFQYDETNEDPASDERVGNEYLRNTMPQFNEDFEGKWNWVNRPKAFDTMYQELVAAVIAGNTVPDIIEMGSSELNLVIRKGAVQDLSEWAQQQEWYDDMDKGAMETCTSADGQLFCIPFAVRPHLVYVWADHYPDGYPDTPEEFMEEAERLKAEGVYAWTYFGSTDFGGDGSTRMIWSLIDSFGGTYDDGEGNLYLTSPETIAAVEFLRETVQMGYNPETVFAGGFIEEDSFKDASAASIPTGLFGYRYINPLTAPDGTEYDKASAEDMLDAIDAGDVVLSEMFAPEGMTPGCGTDIQGLAIPVGAENVEAAYDFINWLMEPERNVQFVLGPGAGTPANTAIFDAPEFETAFYQEAAKALENSVCTPWYGSLDRRGEAKELIMNAVYKVVKEDPTADIAEVFTAAEEEYNAANE
jgi:multiple sugar transport system substrate-binding protein